MREMTGRRKAFLNENEFLNKTKNENAPHSYSGKEELKEMTMETAKRLREQRNQKHGVLFGATESATRTVMKEKRQSVQEVVRAESQIKSTPATHRDSLAASS